MKPRVLVVRSGGRAFDPLGTLRTLDVVERISHRIEPCLEGDAGLDGRFDRVLFTSQIAVERLLSDAELAPRARRALQGARIAAVGSATRDALRRFGLDAHDVGRGSADDLLGRLPEHLKGQWILLPQGADASAGLSSELARRGADVMPLVLYRKVARPPDAELATDIAGKPFAAFCVTAPSAGRWLFSILGPRARDQLRGTPAVALGPSTRRYLEAQSVERVHVPRPVTFSEAALLLEKLAVESATA
jgi:uroporphyrinogen-III synthase